MQTKLNLILKKKGWTIKKLYDKIEKRYETPVALYALSEIVSGKKLNYHIMTLVKICCVLNLKPSSVVELDVLDVQLKKESNEQVF